MDAKVKQLPCRVEFGDIPDWKPTSQTMKNRITQMFRNQLIVATGLVVVGGDKKDIKTVKKLFCDDYMARLKRLTSRDLPDGVERADLEQTYRAHNEVSGDALYAKWLKIKALFKNQWNLLWRKVAPGGKLPSGWSLPQAWRKFRELLWEATSVRKASKKKASSPPKSPLTPKQMPNDFFPAEFMVRHSRK